MKVTIRDIRSNELVREFTEVTDMKEGLIADSICLQVGNDKAFLIKLNEHFYMELEEA